MELLKSFFQPQLHFSHQAMSPDRLTALPLELLVLVCDSLLPVDLVCLCLCNHRLHNLFKRFYHCPTLMYDKLSIFNRLERDLPEYFACDICFILHRYDGSESFGLSGLASNRSNQLPCVMKGYEWPAEVLGGSSISMRTHRGYDHSKNRISFLQVKLAIRRYSYGPRFGINTDSLAFTQVRHYRHPWANPKGPLLVYPPMRTLFSIDAQVCPKPLGLYIRMQDILLLDIWEDINIQVDGDINIMSLYEICRHTSFESKASDIRSLYWGENSSFPYTCPRCNTESLIEFHRINSRAALVMTRWINLGPGIHRDDPLWKLRIFFCNDDTMPSTLGHSLRLQSPRTCFENVASLSFEDLRSRNISYLRGNHYKGSRLFSYDRNHFIWHISYKEPCKQWVVGVAAASAVVLLLYLGLWLTLRWKNSPEPVIRYLIRQLF